MNALAIQPRWRAVVERWLAFLVTQQRLQPAAEGYQVCAGEAPENDPPSFSGHDLTLTQILRGARHELSLLYSYGGSITENMVLPSGDMAEGVIPAAFGSLGQVPTIVIIMLVVTVIAQLALSFTTHGRRMYAIGGNPEAARLSGLRITRYKVAAYVIASLLAGLGGILLASRIGSSQVNAGGGYLMDAVAAAWIGFSLAGSGKPNALGTLVGAVILGVLSNGLVMLSVPYYAMDIIKGLVLAGALALTYFQRRT